MPEYLENPRRVPRISVRCKARLFMAAGAVETTTEDIGSRGCQLIVPEAVQRGDIIGLALNAPRYPMTLRVDGRIAWVSPKPPWRVGIAYAALALPGAARWMEGLRQAAPDLFLARRPQERLAVDAMVFLGPVPPVSEFREDELVVLRTVGAGVRVGDLRTTLSRTWPRMQRALFTLLAQGHVIVSRGNATHPVAWKHILGEAPRPAAELVGDGPARDRTPPDGTARVTAKTPTPPATSRRFSESIEPHETPIATPSVAPRPPPIPKPGARPVPPTPIARLEPAAPHTAPVEPGVREAPPAPDFVGAGVGWRTPARARTAEADNLFKLGMAELEAHRAHGALALLRRALSLAPGDPEIATAIGKAMRGDDPAPP